MRGTGEGGQVGGQVGGIGERGQVGDRWGDWLFLSLAYSLQPSCPHLSEFGMYDGVIDSLAVCLVHHHECADLHKRAHSTR